MTDSTTNITTYYSKSYAAPTSNSIDMSCKSESFAFWNGNGVITASCQSDPGNRPSANTTYVDSALDLTACTFPRKVHGVDNGTFDMTTCNGFHFSPGASGMPLVATCAGVLEWIGPLGKY